MAGERQTEPHQAVRSLTEIWQEDGAEAAWRARCLQAEAELARVRAERDEAQETVGEWKLRAERAEHERDEISASLAKMDTKWRHAYNRLRDYEDRGTTDQFSEMRRRAEAAEARIENQAAEIVALIRSYANVHMTKALADLIEHKYVGRPPQR